MSWSSISRASAATTRALFGAMLISRFAIDAVGRQGRPASERRPHLLVVDEAQRFHTQAMEGILAEGRKFGLVHAPRRPVARRPRGDACAAPFARTWPRSRSWSPAPTTSATWAGCSPRSPPRSSWRCALYAMRPAERSDRRRSHAVCQGRVRLPPDRLTRPSPQPIVRAPPTARDARTLDEVSSVRRNRLREEGRQEALPARAPGRRCPRAGHERQAAGSHMTAAPLSRPAQSPAMVRPVPRPDAGIARSRTLQRIRGKTHYERAVLPSDRSERPLKNGLDPACYDARDRACLRFLLRFGASHADHSSRRSCIRQPPTCPYRLLRRLWQARACSNERRSLPIRGRDPESHTASVRPGMQAPRVPGSTHGRRHAYVRHALEPWSHAVCALNRSDAATPSRLWLPESIADDASGGTGASRQRRRAADGRLAPASCASRSTRPPSTRRTIRAKLADYDRGLAGRLGWHVVFVVPTEHRLAWMRRVVRGDRATVAGHVWATTFADLEHAGLDAPVVPVGGAGERQPLRSLLDEPRPRRCPTPVASPAWVELLGSGGGEDLDEALR